MKDAFDLVSELIEASSVRDKAQAALDKALRAANESNSRVESLKQQLHAVLKFEMNPGQCVKHVDHIVRYDRIDGVVVEPINWHIQLSKIPLTPEPIPAELASWSKHDPDGTLHEAAQAFQVDQTV